ncbi:putative START-like domain, Bet v I type allergen [Medicago truncatula]|uniref:Putative START-like domain, Bet v I type allergen n=1 Tax=Medicago truncatula TaxID=3880 RepID=A0A396IFH7_MEDTR|nr:ABA-responsive protein ABR18 [Medicago truncatula]RHN64329.1 putative START-like domain, Bet v I type allergen [Medicago truncatula]
MGVFTFEQETTSTVAPAKLYKALVHDSDDIIPKAVDAIKSVETVEGNGGAGTIKKLTFVEGGQTLYVLHQIDAIDEANLGYNYSIVGGVGLPETVEKISFEAKLVEGPNGGSIGKTTVKYQTKGDAKPIEKEVEEGKAKGDALFKAIEGYVLANPNYN